MADHIIFVSCVGKKSSYCREARLIYQSEWFLKTRTLVESMGCPWFILSAEHGLLDPSTKIEPYDRTLNTMSKVERVAWANQVIRQIDVAGVSPKKITFFAGERYREFIVPSLKAKGIDVAIPMEGLRIGEQLRWLSRSSQDYR